MQQQGELKRSIGLPGALLIGLGSIVGTGVFVSLGLAAGEAGWALPLAVLIAALLAALNGLSSAQLAAAYPVSGGTYEYAYRLLNPLAGFSAGWLFTVAKCASAATAALGAASYLLRISGLTLDERLPALGFVLLLTLLCLLGLRRSNWLNLLLVALSLCALLAFCILALPQLPGSLPAAGELLPTAGSLPALLSAAALVFVAFTGYGRIATLGEELLDPRRNIPRALLITLLVACLLYLAVGLSALALLGPREYSAASAANAAPLEHAARVLGQPWLPGLLAIGALAAMLGVLLNLVLGISRVLLAMARRGDMPRALAAVDSAGESPRAAVLTTGALIAVLVAIGSIKLAWSLSAFTVLVYYALTNLSALRLPAESRLYPRALAWTGLAGCLGLAAFIDWRYTLLGTALLASGLVWFALARRLAAGR